MSTKSILENLKVVLLKPRALLLIDAVGAAVTTIANVYLLAAQRIEVGLPVELLYAMACYAACLVCFDVVALARPDAAKVRMDAAVFSFGDADFFGHGQAPRQAANRPA